MTTRAHVHAEDASTPVRVRDIVRELERIAPLSYAEPWDKVGLLAGDSTREVTGPILLTIDLTERVLEEAIASHASMIIAYHPPIFEPLARVTDTTPRQRIILRALQAGMAIYSPHTALDAIPGGVADWLCEGLSGSTTTGKILGDCRALSPHAAVSDTAQCKIVTFARPQDVDTIRGALATAGAGRIGEYHLCSFSCDGTGTFIGSEHARPTVGKPGEFERVNESRLEMVCPKASVALAIETLRRFHPYEEPPIDVYDLAPQPMRSVGAGRRLVLDRPARPSEIAQRFKKFLGRDRLRMALAGKDDPITHIGVVPGSGQSLSRLAAREECQLFVTGEMSHHDVIGALHAGMSVLLGGHTSTERGYMPRLGERLTRDLTQRVGPRAKHLQVIVSASDADPLEIV